ncbi:hypothetical protein SELR_12480 [Selenomonas ruminantium subsp. lactilytica TAM6421]|uniref:Uncharacterized protein n=1 Tax=Selenomonas ruminantium subsp. lactilytica (strain NBRC 103574 / TAM6421) TaxID=927704 RepID=I0GQB9_SELRL|nr:hypothetical protein [Selenomonas ruminantium]BAL82956.1 hypothetical protein SELR_12480 [Selenomonas ruminantium subsp. lactilytica TAM6421]
MNTTINIGDRFGHLTVIAKDPRSLHRGSWLCRCDCGKEIYVITSDLVRGIKSCGCSHFSDKYSSIDLTGQRFGHLTVISRDNSARNNTKWLCHCDCGNDVYFYTGPLIKGKRRSCGCKTGTKEIQNLDLVGQRFGYLTVIVRDSRPRRTSSWLCRCDCGKEIYLLTSDLRGGVKSCGCSQRVRKYTLFDLTGRQFGHLKVIARHPDPLHKSQWLCRCDCGNEGYFSATSLITGRRRSCGCVTGTNYLNTLNLVGERFGHLTVIARNKNPLYRSNWLCRCDCGNEVYLRTSLLLKGLRSCGCHTGTSELEIIDLIGQKFGRLTVISRHRNPKRTRTWICRCECGNEVSLTTSRLLNGHDISCGCSRSRNRKFHIPDLIGKHIKHLTVISHSNNPLRKSSWICRCDCGNTFEVTTSAFLRGAYSSCGCLKSIRDKASIDLTGKRFGHLTVIARSSDTDYKSKWHCFCDCGNDVYLSTSQLINNQKATCGRNCKYLRLQNKETLIGKRFHHLTVKRILEISPHDFRLLCLCDCGEYTLATTSQLTQGIKRSCGCNLKKWPLHGSQQPKS